jgi:endonuclease YncB( thermonuclease family)
MKRLAPVLAVLVVSGCGSDAEPSRDQAAPRGLVPREPDRPKREPARVSWVSDGDSIKVRIGDREEQVRLIGIDAPENSFDRFGRLECGGGAAFDAMRALAPLGSNVRVVSDPRAGRRDRFGRLLAYVDGPKGDVGEAQVLSGHAIVFNYRGRGFSRLGRYEQAQAAARAAGRGAWRTCGGDFHRPRRSR